MCILLDRCSARSAGKLFTFSVHHLQISDHPYISRTARGGCLQPGLGSIYWQHCCPPAAAPSIVTSWATRQTLHSLNKLQLCRSVSRVYLLHTANAEQACSLHVMHCEHFYEGVHEAKRNHMIVPAAPPQSMELAAIPKIARKPSPEGAADAGLPGTTLLSPCMASPAASVSLRCYPFALNVSRAESIHMLCMAGHLNASD